MCECKDVSPGSYENQVILKTPSHMQEYRKHFTPGCDTGFISVDRCLADEIMFLWSLGITTTGCCCGHNHYYSNEGEIVSERVISFPYIGVLDKDVAAMKSLGYQTVANEFDIERNDEFKPKTITNERKHVVGTWRQKGSV